MTQSPRIVIAGASGYIGRALIPKILEHFPKAEITALSRNPQTHPDARVNWKACELFSLKSLEEALPSEVDLAYYLVHSMSPTAHLDQGSFADYDLLLADNFARAVKKINVRHVIYLGGLTPNTSSLSLHLQSRLEVEKTFQYYQLPTTVFRAGLILGEDGSSFQILLKLVKRLPIMVCPGWTKTLTTPVDLTTVIESLVSAALDLKHLGKVYDLAGCEPLTYLQMMRTTAQWLNKKRFFFTVPFFTPTLSRLWVSLITQSSKDLVYPLIESLEHPMVARASHLFINQKLRGHYSDLLSTINPNSPTRKTKAHFHPQQRTVRSVQRLPLPLGKNADWTKNHYIQWLPSFLKPLIRVTLNEDIVSFSILRRKWILLELRSCLDRSDEYKQVLYINRGLLVGENNRGRLEFRAVLDRHSIIAAIHDYRPSLPWFIYRYTQAKIHLLVMKAFAKELSRIP